MKTAALILSLILSLPAFAGATIAFGQYVISRGDAAGSVRKKAGEPDRVVPIETAQGGAVGERWEYDLNGKTVVLHFASGRLVYIEEIRD